MVSLTYGIAKKEEIKILEMESKKVVTGSKVWGRWREVGKKGQTPSYRMSKA